MLTVLQIDTENSTVQSDTHYTSQYDRTVLAQYKQMVAYTFHTTYNKRHVSAQNLINSATLCFPVHMTVMSKRPTSRSASSPASSSSSRARQCTTVQARQPLWPSTCTGPAYSTHSRLHSWAWPLITGLPPTSTTPLPACRLLTVPSTATPRPSLPHWIQSPTIPTGLTKSACTTPALLRALTDDGFPGCSQFWGGRNRDDRPFLLNRTEYREEKKKACF